MKKILLSLAIASCALHAIEPTQVKIYTIPGVNGGGSEPEYVRSIIGNNCQIIPIEIPSERNADLGQSNCQSYLINKLKKENGGVLIHATSQGAATALNVLAQEHALFKGPGKKIRGLILEGTVASGNSAIYRTITGPLGGYKTLKKIPLSYLFLPYAAKLATFPSYWPCGQQPITSISNIPNDVPIIIIHSRKDPQVSFHDAYALFSGLILQGKNAYFVAFEGSNHIQILDDENKKNIVQAILSKEKIIKTNLSDAEIQNILYVTSDSTDLQTCRYKMLDDCGEAYSNLKWKEHMHVAFALALGTAVTAAIVKGAWSLYNYLFKRKNVPPLNEQQSSEIPTT